MLKYQFLICKKDNSHITKVMMSRITIFFSRITAGTSFDFRSYLDYELKGDCAPISPSLSQAAQGLLKNKLRGDVRLIFI